ncbi:His/Gly/Thr/Pro-type tRNA ligase C-terminal domain-containing protein [Staphylococcus kloosii]|uniref:His/Gly/Thr/Pro-type tRNA ligase C-terminal domain-containing protein n=1 Tax=Staphylococcus kloosii TaxID=29384 RepID=UPI0022773694|nr:His/Gly/Thr/Pro-type tRNA ligase C-terminal domain-containing protein [Staphylococcus kloosii]
MPYKIIVGDNELREFSLSIRKHGEQYKQVLAVSDFIEMLIKEKIYYIDILEPLITMKGFFKLFG